VHEHVLDVAGTLFNTVVQRQCLTAGISEHVADTVSDETIDKLFSNVHGGSSRRAITNTDQNYRSRVPMPNRDPRSLQRIRLFPISVNHVEPLLLPGPGMKSAAIKIWEII
jgi:hypothetical protein